MNHVLKVCNEITDYWYRLSPTGNRFASDDKFATFYTSKFLIQDTSGAVSSHMQTGFSISTNSMAAYIEFWGVMQALIIQQDAICELHGAVCGIAPILAKPSAWFDLRELRNRCAGHPAKKSVKGSTLRSFMVRTSICYERMMYEQYDSATESSTHPTVDLRAMINSYDTQAGGVLSAVLSEMKRKWPQL